MTLFDNRESGGLRPQPSGDSGGGESLGLDDLVSRSGDDLDLEVDATGHLVLIEGRDFD